MLAEMAIADAYAIPWEFTDQQTGKNDLSMYYQHPTYAALTKGQYTDDTQRAIANAEVLLSGDAMDPFTPLSYACYMVNAYKRDRRDGYSRGFQALLDSVDHGAELLQKVQRTKDSNGSVMGVAPLGFISDIPSLKMAATIQAISTHHPSTAIHAQIVALAAHYFIHGVGDRTGLVNFVVEHTDWVSADQKFRWLGEMSNYSVDPSKPTTIKAQSISAYVVHAAFTMPTLGSIMMDAVARGGDTDSAAAGAVAVASCSKEVEYDIPAVLSLALDYANPHYGTLFLSGLEQRLRSEYVEA